MTAQPPRATTPGFLLFPEWVVTIHFFAAIPLELTIGYLAYRGHRRTDSSGARILML